MTVTTFQSLTSCSKQRLEALFLLSPLAVLLAGIFNITDTKSILSRLIPIICVYCLFFYRDAIKHNWQTQSVRPLIATSLLAFFYFGFAHLFRGDEFGYSRTLVACLAYLLLVPWKRLPRQYLARFLPVAAILCGLNAMYEFWGMNIARVGVATNPIPYALFCAVMVLGSLHQLLSAKSRGVRLVSILGIGSAGMALLLTDVRGVILFFPIVMAYLALRILPLSGRAYLAVLLTITSLCGLGYKAFEEKIDKRIEFTAKEFSQIAKGNFNTSIGTRLTLWQQGKDTFLRSPILGVGDEVLHADIKALPIHHAAIQPHLHNQYIDTLARYGLIGLFILLAWILSPLFYSKPKGGVGARLDPLLTSVIFMIALAGLTDVPFHHTHLVYLFTLFTGAWLMMPIENTAPEISDS
ncbi:O-antigen ligase [Enterovibrio norvegicus]|uniref:O-antigen ligase family protein n=1 Tax=Enterovibrio norvegicus TaxID=188144 RepID=UPI000C81A820|nr:O-antigen ligase family protein [Enterovibrio norvegicus]MCC4797880.1 O-antigen ligase family protein [Enterovibrio norvegicus]PMI33019.1 O-antigen ligase [Enterovibrio norvegicus]PMI34871.1 O-antigen ligase [Enterovibrio norvegicus]PMN45078.1 O-antigen ligase [Enterovibrio norvegicus]TKF11025.1 O-antigen ligase family protein [Enterovibrio norvegicus]